MVIALIVGFILISILMLLVIIGGGMSKSEYERRMEDQEQMEYLKKYRNKNGGNY